MCKEVAEHWDTARMKHETSPLSAYPTQYSRYMGYGDDEYSQRVKAEMLDAISRLPGVVVEGDVRRTGRRYDPNGTLTVMVSPDYDPKVEYPYSDHMPKFKDYETLRQDMIKECTENRDAALRHAREIAKQIAWHAANDTTPLVPGPKPKYPSAGLVAG